MNNRRLFLEYVAQTSPFPLQIEIEKAQGSILYTPEGKEYIDLISGISVSNVGHCHPRVVKAVQEQAAKYMHLMVYGEIIQGPQVKLAEKIASLLPSSLHNIYFVNSGSEAIEGAMKLCKRYTKRTEIISFINAYHGSTTGALSIIGSEKYKNAFRPLMPMTRAIRFNNEEDLKCITTKTAAVFIEPIQGEAGIILPENNFLKKLRAKCDETGTLLVFDEVQSGFGRTGKMFAFEHYGVVPDLLICAKGMGGGMPIGAFISSKEIMSCLTESPILGHITTFGGHPVSCAASLACIEVIEEERLLEDISTKEALFRRLLVHHKIKSIRGKGLFLAVEFESREVNFDINFKCLENGVFVDWFLFNDKSLRIAPPLTISAAEIEMACNIILQVLEM
ncbi:MAG: aspartate aminotransferase family protein [Bacteroidetes bacterium]|nr:aspartate aminotransferase family protein [Bacteroidota bacterium]